MSNTVIDEHCATIRKYGADITIEQLKTSFDVFVSVLKEIDSYDIKCTLIEQMIVPLANLPHRNKKLAESEMITHEFFVILRDDVIIEQLWRRQIEDNIIQKLLLSVSILFINLSHNINDTNAIEFKHLLFHKPLVDELANCFNEIGTSGKYLNDPTLLCSIRYLLLTFKHFLINQIIANDYLLITPIFSAVIKCLSSSHAVDMIKSLEKNFNHKLNVGQMLFLDTMPWYLQWYSDYRDPENFIKIVRILLKEFTAWMTSCHPDSYLRCSSHIAGMIHHLNHFFVRPTESDNLSIFSEEFYDDYCKLVSHWSTILSSTLTSSYNKMNAKYCTRIMIQNLYNFTLHLNVLNYMKTIPNLISMLLKVTDVDNDEIQMNAYRCLGKIMMEADLKTMAKPGKIAAVYIEFITKTIDDSKKTERFHSLFESLKNFVQHDQVKSELVEQKAIPLLVKCVVETRFDPVKVQQIALEILLALSFNNDACSILRQDQQFASHIRILAGQTNADKSGLQRAAEGLLWKLEKEEEAVAKPTTLNSYKHDIMISYSHKDEELCLRIHDQLIKDGFSVWVDRDCLRGSLMAGIANAIENSEYVLICMSNMYKQSVYCQSEAHYAFERGCRLIPIIIESNYKPDGWLGIIVCGKIYVDFARIEFKLAYENLKNEIDEYRHHHLSQSSIKLEANDQVEPVTICPDHIELAPELIVDLPDCITEWTHDHVRSFFQRMGLGSTMLPLCTCTDGHRLLQLYEICLINRESMYQSLKFELNERHHTLLPIADYLTFLHEIKLYVPITSTNVNTPRSSFLSFTFCNVL